MCFTSDSVIDDDIPSEPDETFVLEIDGTDPDDPRITVTDGTTTIIIVDSDDCEFEHQENNKINELCGPVLWQGETKD
jgi:hypothetical protein